MNATINDHADGIEAITRNGRDLVAVLQAYLDESCREHRDLFLVTGTLFYPRRAKRLARAWPTIFPRPFHARTFNAPPISRQDRLRLRRAGQAIAQEAEYVACVSCSIESAKEVLAAPGSAQAKAYLACGAIAAFCLAAYLKREGRPDRIAYLYDRRQGESAAALGDVFDRIYQREDLRHMYRFQSQAHGVSEEDPLLQAADFVTWEFGKGKELRDAGEPPRECFADLILGLREKEQHRNPPTAFYYRDYRPAELEDFRKWIEGAQANVPVVLQREEPLR